MGSGSSANKYKPEDAAEVSSAVSSPTPTMKASPSSPTVSSRIEAIRRARFTMDSQDIEEAQLTEEQSSMNRTAHHRSIDERPDRSHRPKEQNGQNGAMQAHSSFQSMPQIQYSVGGTGKPSPPAKLEDDMDFELNRLILQHESAPRLLLEGDNTFKAKLSSDPHNDELHRLISGREIDVDGHRPKTPLDDLRPNTPLNQRLVDNGRQRHTALQGLGKSVLEDSRRPNMLAAVGEAGDNRPNSVLSSSRPNILTAPELEGEILPRSALKSSESRIRPSAMLHPNFADNLETQFSQSVSSSGNRRDLSGVMTLQEMPTTPIVGAQKLASSLDTQSSSRIQASPRQRRVKPNTLTPASTSASRLDPNANVQSRSPMRSPRSPRRAAIQQERRSNNDLGRVGEQLGTSAHNGLCGFRAHDRVTTYGGADASGPWARMGEGCVQGPDPSRRGFLMVLFERTGESFSIKASNLTNLTDPRRSPKGRDQSPTQSVSPSRSNQELSPVGMQADTIMNSVACREHDPMGGFKIGEIVGIGEGKGFGMGTVVQEGSVLGQLLVSCGDVGIRSVHYTQLIKHSKPSNVMGEIDNEVIRSRVRENRKQVALSLFESSLGAPSKQQQERQLREEQEAREAAFYATQDLSMDPNKGFRPGDHVIVLNKKWHERGRGCIKAFGERPGTVKVQFGRHHGDWWTFDVNELEKEVVEEYEYGHYESTESSM